MTFYKTFWQISPFQVLTIWVAIKLEICLKTKIQMRLLLLVCLFVCLSFFFFVCLVCLFVCLSFFFSCLFCLLVCLIGGENYYYLDLFDNVPEECESAHQWKSSDSWRFLVKTDWWKFDDFMRWGCLVWKVDSWMGRQNSTYPCQWVGQSVSDS